MNLYLKHRRWTNVRSNIPTLTISMGGVLRIESLSNIDDFIHESVRCCLVIPNVDSFRMFEKLISKIEL